MRIWIVQTNDGKNPWVYVRDAAADRARELRRGLGMPARINGSARYNVTFGIV